MISVDTNYPPWHYTSLSLHTPLNITSLRCSTFFILPSVSMCLDHSWAVKGALLLTSGLEGNLVWKIQGQFKVESLKLQNIYNCKLAYQNSFWWPKKEQEIQLKIKNCETKISQLFKKNLNKVTWLPWWWTQSQPLVDWSPCQGFRPPAGSLLPPPWGGARPAPGWTWCPSGSWSLWRSLPGWWCRGPWWISKNSPNFLQLIHFLFNIKAYW